MELLLYMFAGLILIALGLIIGMFVAKTDKTKLKFLYSTSTFSVVINFFSYTSLAQNFQIERIFTLILGAASFGLPIFLSKKISLKNSCISATILIITSIILLLF